MSRYKAHGVEAEFEPGSRGREKERYIDAIRTGVGRDYEPMIAVFRRIISRTLKSENAT